MPKYKGIVASSQDPDQIANTVKGIVLGLSAAIILVVSLLFHITLTTDNVTLAADIIGTDAGAIWGTYGLLMKAVVFFGKNKPQ